AGSPRAPSGSSARPPAPSCPCSATGSWPSARPKTSPPTTRPCSSCACTGRRPAAAEAASGPLVLRASARAQVLARLGQRQRGGEEVALPVVAARFSQHAALPLGLHALGHH